MNTKITVYGCEQDEAALFRELCPSFNIEPLISPIPVSEQNAPLALDSRCISVSHKTRVSDHTLSALHKAGVRYVSTRSVGYNHIDLEAAGRLGISVGNITYSPDGVADHTLMLILMAVRNAKSVISRTVRNDFSLDSTRAREISDMTIGVVGTGRIGAAVIKRLGGFGCRILAYDHHPKIAADYVPLDELLQKSDVISLHTPLCSETYHLINHERLKLVKDGAFIVNTSRGPLIDTAALIDALECGKLSGTALDVLEGEEGVFYSDLSQSPPEHRHLKRLQEFPNVTITPHTAYYTKLALRDTVSKTLEGCLAFEREKKKWIS